MRRSPRSPACAPLRWRCPARSPSTGTGSPTPPSGPPWTRPATPSSGPEQVVSVTTERGTGTAVPGQPPGPRTTAVDLAVTGMTCSSCSARIAKRLNRLDGVSATVNFATETAAVRYDPARLGPEDIVATIEATGYGVRRPEPPEPDGAGADGVDAAVASLRQRLTVSTVLTLPVLALAMIAPLQFDNWQWLSLTLASPVVIWGGWPFHRAALANLRHRAATMDTLVSMGTLAAYLWSLYALFLGDAGMPGMRMRFAVAASVPIETSVSMVAARCRRLASAARWNGQPPQMTTGEASVSDSHCQLSNCNGAIIARASTGSVRTADTVRRCRSEATAASCSAAAGSTPSAPAPSGSGGSGRRTPYPVASMVATMSSGPSLAGS